MADSAIKDTHHAPHPLQYPRGFGGKLLIARNLLFLSLLLHRMRIGNVHKIRSSDLHFGVLFELRTGLLRVALFERLSLKCPSILYKGGEGTEIEQPFFTKKCAFAHSHHFHKCLHIWETPPRRGGAPAGGKRLCGTRGLFHQRGDETDNVRQMRTGQTQCTHGDEAESHAVSQLALK